jgi:hypothetical protein
MERGVTGEEVRAAVEAAGIQSIDHHDCRGCGYMTQYQVHDGRLYFCPGCFCGSRFSPPEPRDWGDAADWINMQSRPDVRDELRARFGLQALTPNTN